MNIDLTASLPFIFVTSLSLGLTIYLVGHLVTAKGEKSAGKVAPYACGEDLPICRFQVNVEDFLLYAVYFLIFDILIFNLATSLGKPGFFPTVYASIVFMAVIILTPLRR